MANERTLQVVDRGDRRAAVIGVTRESEQARALEAWLSERADVVHFERRIGSGSIAIEYDDGNALPGRFLRGLRDCVYRLHTSAITPEAYAVTPVHSLKGRVRVRVTGISESQLATLTMVTAGLPHIRHATHVPWSRTALFSYDADQVTEDAILAALRTSGPSEWDREWHRPPPLRWIGALSGTSVLFMCITGATSPGWLTFGVVLNTLRPLARSLVALGEGQVSIDLLDVAATFAALATGRYTTAAFVIWMVGIGDLLLDVSAHQARSALSTLLRRGEREATRVLPDGTRELVPVGALEVGDLFAVRAGHGIVADGRVLSGLAEVDEKALNGESRLLSKKVGDPVFASTVVVEGELVVRMECSGKDSEAAKIERILNTVGSKPLTLQRDALDFASKLVLPTFGVAWIAAVLGGDVTRGVCVLITDFGTGIRIAVPTTALTAMSLAARQGVLVKGAQYLERLAKTDVIVFDKTGTLTTGVPEVVEVVTARGVKQSTLVQLCASAEAQHDHPVARALKSCAQERGIPLIDVEPGSDVYTVGLGLSARVDGRRLRVGRAVWMESQGLKLSRTFQRHLARFEDDCVSSLCVAVDDRVVGVIAYSDGTRPECAAILRRLRAGGRRRLVLLSGDSPEVARKVALALGIDEAVGGLLPEQKAEYVKTLRAAGRVVAMVGDGINDAPALAMADVGISIAGSTDVALETADVVLLDGGLSRIERAFRIGDRAMASVRQNLGVVIAPNAIAIALGAFGLITPPIAAVINNGATMLAVLVGTIPLLRGGPRHLLEEAAREPMPVASRVRDVPASMPRARRTGRSAGRAARTPSKG